MDHAFERALSHKFHLRFVIWCGIDGKFIAQILEREFQARSEFSRVGNRVGQIREKRCHLHRRFKVAFAVAGKQPPGICEHFVIAQAGKHIQDFSLWRQGVADAVGCK